MFLDSTNSCIYYDPEVCTKENLPLLEHIQHHIVFFSLKYQDFQFCLIGLYLQVSYGYLLIDFQYLFSMLIQSKFPA